MDYNAGIAKHPLGDYDPLLGKFISADTIIPDPGNPLAWDRYGYAYNNPIMFSDPTGHFTEDAITDYLLNYFSGDEEAALRTLLLWKQDKEWWGMVSVAQAGDTVVGYYYATEGDSNRPTGVIWEGYTSNFLGNGIDELIGMGELDLVCLQKGQFNLEGINFNIEYNGMFRMTDEGMPLLWGKEELRQTYYPDWVRETMRISGNAIQYSIVTLSATLLLGPTGGAVSFFANFIIDQAQDNFPTIGDLIVDAANAEENDHLVNFGPIAINFQKQQNDMYVIEDIQGLNK